MSYLHFQDRVIHVSTVNKLFCSRETAQFEIVML